MRKTKIQSQSTKGDPVLEELPLACADEKAAVEFMEKQRWGDHPHCPHCGDESVYQMKNIKTGERQANYRWRCNGCKAQFTVRIGSVLEDSRIPLRHWCFAFWRAATSKKGVSALEIHRQTGLSYKSSLFLLNRIRCAMQEEPVTPLNGIVEVDEVYLGGKPRRKGNKVVDGVSKKYPVVAMVERDGRVRARPVASVTSANLKEVMEQFIDPAARIMTDEAKAYISVASNFAEHLTVNHGDGEYARGDVTTNRVEGFFNILRRGIHGIYHNVSREHLQKYLSEYEFRFTHRELGDGERTRHAIRCARGKRLTYEQSKA